MEEEKIINPVSLSDIDKHIKEFQIKEKNHLVKIHFKMNDIEKVQSEIDDIMDKFNNLEKNTESDKYGEVYMNPYLEAEFQSLNKILMEKDNKIQNTEIQNTFQIHQHQTRSVEFVVNMRNENSNLGALYNKGNTIEEETKLIRDKIIKLKKTLGDLNQQIGVLEKEQKNQTDQISAQKRLINEEKKKKERLLEEINEINHLHR